MSAAQGVNFVGQIRELPTGFQNCGSTGKEVFCKRRTPRDVFGKLFRAQRVRVKEDTVVGFKLLCKILPLALQQPDVSIAPCFAPRLQLLENTAVALNDRVRPWFP